MSDSSGARTWQVTLEQIPTRFGRLVYLASLLDANSGRYRHHGLAQVVGAEEAERTIRLSHEEAFSEWLRLSLREQHSDLRSYVEALPEENPEVLETWSLLEPYRAMVPAAAGHAERLLYETDLEVILELLRSEHGASESA